MKINCVIKNRFLGKRIEDEYGHPFKFDNAKIKYFKAEKPEDVELEIEMGGKKTPRLIANDRRFEFYTGRQTIFNVKGKPLHVNVNFENGEISPAFQPIVGSLCADQDGKVFRLENDGTTTYSQYTYTPSRNYDNLAQVIDENGKRGVIDEKFNVVVPFVYDKEFGLGRL